MGDVYLNYLLVFAFSKQIKFPKHAVEDEIEIIVCYEIIYYYVLFINYFLNKQKEIDTSDKNDKYFLTM